MNSLEQDKSLLIGSQKDIQVISQKDSCSILVISDSHGNYQYVKDILNQNGASSDILIYLGDGIQDLIYCFEQSFKEEYFKYCLPPVIAFVQGNNDTDFYSYRNITSYSKIQCPLNQILTVCNKRLFLTHGNRYSVYSGLESLSEAALKNDCSIALFGHTHVASVKEFNNILTFNPGSCSLPRQGQPCLYAKINIKKDEEKINYTFYEYSYKLSKIYSL